MFQHHGCPKQRMCFEFHVGWESQTSVAEGASRLSPPHPGGHSQLEQAHVEKAFSPGNREEHSDGPAVSVGGTEDRAMDTCHTRTILFLIQAPHLTGEETETYWEGGIWSVPWIPWPPFLFLPNSSCHSQIKRFAFILLDYTKLTRKAGCNEAPTWFPFPWQGRENTDRQGLQSTRTVLQKVVTELESQKNNALAG